MMTGHHTEMTGVLDREVTDGQGGVWKYDTDPEFWNYDVNMTTIWVRMFSYSQLITSTYVSIQTKYMLCLFREGLKINQLWKIPY